MKTTAEINNYLKSIGHSANQFAADSALKQLMEGEDVVAAWGYNSIEDTLNNSSYTTNTPDIFQVILLTNIGRIIYGESLNNYYISEYTSPEKSRAGLMSVKLQIGHLTYEMAKSGSDKLMQDLTVFINDCKASWEAHLAKRKSVTDAEEAKRQALIKAAIERNRQMELKEAEERKAHEAEIEENRKKAEERERKRIEAENARKLEQLEKRSNEIATQNIEFANNAFYEYKTFCIYDTRTGSISKSELDNTIAEHARASWRLVFVFTNEAGKNSSSIGYGGVSVGTNATMDATYLVFERCIKPDTHPVTTNPVSAADEIEKLHSLMERGIITQDEFNAKKAQLLK